MGTESFRILSPCGILGYGFPDASFDRGLSENPDAIIVDAGSTDAGPHKLGANVAIVSRRAYKKDLSRLIHAGFAHKIPVIVGSAGGSGAKAHVDWTLSILDEILEDLNNSESHLRVKIAVISADIPKKLVREKLAEGKITPMSRTVPILTKEAIAETTGIVAQMGHEPILEALENGADIVICGRAYDPAPFAAAAIRAGFDPGLAYHMGKILECGALCADPGTAKDCILGEIKQDCFEVHSLNPELRCTKTSVAAHTFYEKAHPYLLPGPGELLDLERCEFSEVRPGVIRVSGSRLHPVSPYRIKLEGARRIAYRTFTIAGVRDPLLVGEIEKVETLVRESIRAQYADLNPEAYQVNFYNYGKNAVMGEAEPADTPAHELGVLFEVVAETQEIASTVCASVRSTFLHYGYSGRKSTAGNLAFPFAPSDVEFGAVYEFSVYHLMEIDDPKAPFPIVYREIGGTK